jgi:hypothetical protein
MECGAKQLRVIYGKHATWQKIKLFILNFCLKQKVEPQLEIQLPFNWELENEKISRYLS